jgi:serine/threonine-protein phosphatase PP1 catalytic subunit
LRRASVALAVTGGWRYSADVASEYESLKSIIKKMRLSKEQAKEMAEKAYQSELARGRPDLALKCAKDYSLGDALLTEAATALVRRLLKEKRFAEALEVARGFNLAQGGEDAARVLAEGSRAAEKQSDEDSNARAVLSELRRLAAAAQASAGPGEAARKAIEQLREAAKVRAADAKLRGRAVFLEPKGDLWLTGDLHGNLDNLKRFVALAELDKHPDRILVVQEILHARLITADQRDLSFIACLEAANLVRRYPGRVYFLLGNHDLAFHQGRELVKGGKYLNRFLMKGLAYMYRERHEDVADEYKKFIGNMPAAIVAPCGVFMSHSTPKRAFIPSITLDYLTTKSMKKPLAECNTIVALVNGRDYDQTSADEFARAVGCEAMVCGHTPTPKGYRRWNTRHLVIDSQHEHGCYVTFDLAGRVSGAEELESRVQMLVPEMKDSALVNDLM